MSGFSFIDHGGNWIRVFHDRAATPEAEEDDPPTSRLGRTLANAIVLADSKGDVEQAAKILAGALSRAGAGADEAERSAAQSYLDELLARLTAAGG